MEALFRLTTNSSALGVVFLWYDKQKFIVSDTFFNVWRRVLGMIGTGPA